MGTKILTKVVLRRALKVTGTVCLGAASVMKASETDETVQKLLIKIAPKLLKKFEGS